MANFEIQIANKTINYMLMIKKELYTSPEVKAFDVRIEGVICTSGEFDPNQWNPGNNDWFVNP